MAFSFFIFSYPRPLAPCAHLRNKLMETTLISFCLFFCAIFVSSIFVCALSCFNGFGLSIQHVCSFLRLCFQKCKRFLVVFYFMLLVVWIRIFFRSRFVFVPGFFGLFFFFVLFLFLFMDLFILFSIFCFFWLYYANLWFSSEA